MTRRLVPSLLTMLALISFVSVASQAQQAPAVQSPELRAWRTNLKNTALPHHGCFQASFPTAQWWEVSCATDPNRPIGQPKIGDAPTVGNLSGDFVADVTGLTSATGSFPVLTNVTSSNAYTLQINANTFTTALCTAPCKGWQQFVYDQGGGSVFMQYWLIGYGSSCPSGWTEYQGSCYKNSSVVGAPQNMPITQLLYTELIADASGGTDAVYFYSNDGSASATASDTVFNLEQHWDEAEFNVFGDGGGTEVNLNSGATVLVQLQVTNGTNQVPGYSTVSLTGETNNLNLVASAPCLYGGTSPMIQFVESNTTATQTCGVSGANPVEMSPTAFSFVGKPNQGDQYKTVTITNETSSTITISSQGITNETGYFLWKNCPTTLPAKASCVTSVGFDFVGYPQNSSYSGTLTVVTSAGTVGARLSAFVK